MITATRIDRYFTVTECGTLPAGNKTIFPDLVHVVHWQPGHGEPVTVWVRGPVRRRDGSPSAARAVATYGRFGSPTADAPDWVRKLTELPGVDPTAVQP